jgi:short-subunit dehydrogenase
MNKILITGATKGLGRETAVWFAKKKFKLILVGRNEEDLKKLLNQLQHKKNHNILCLDLQKPEQINKINIKQKMFAGLDRIIHCAGGGLGIKSPFLNYDDFLTLLNLNFLSAVEINNKFMPILKKKESRIIHIGSIASFEAVGSVGYNCAKSILLAYVRSVGRLMIKNKITVTGILPGGFIGYKNAMWRLKKRNLTAYNKFIKSRLPSQKMYNSKDLIPMIDMMCSSNISMLSSNMVVMDGGEGKSYFQ